MLLDVVALQRVAAAALAVRLLVVPECEAVAASVVVGYDAGGAVARGPASAVIAVAPSATITAAGLGCE